MHITVEHISIVKVDFEVFPEHASHLSYDFNVSCDTHYPEDNLLIQIIEFRINDELEDAPFRLNATFLSQFRSEGEGQPSLEEFGKYNAPAYVVPYAREIIANLTSRAGIIPTLVIPPINVFDLIRKSPPDDDEPTLGLEETIEEVE